MTVCERSGLSAGSSSVRPQRSLKMVRTNLRIEDGVFSQHRVCNAPCKPCYVETSKVDTNLVTGPDGELNLHRTGQSSHIIFLNIAASADIPPVGERTTERTPHL